MSNSSFSQALPFMQIAWDSTSMGTLMECPRKYQYSIIEGWQPRQMSVHLAFGIHYHSALETYDRVKVETGDHDRAVVAAVRRALEDTWDYTLNRPWNSDDKNKNRFTLIRTVVWYLAQFREDPLETIILANGKPAVELSFRFETEYVSPEGSPFILCGHLDRLVMWNERPRVVDRKTSKNSIEGEEFFARFTPDNQMSTYDFAGSVVYNLPILEGVIIDAAQVMVTFSRFRRGFAHRTPAQRHEWYMNLGHWLRLASQYAEQRFWPMNTKSCGNYGGCPFRPVCSKSPETREGWLASLYVKRTWDPLQIRGDI